MLHKNHGKYAKLPLTFLLKSKMVAREVTNLDVAFD